MDNETSDAKISRLDERTHWLKVALDERLAFLNTLATERHRARVLLFQILTVIGGLLSIYLLWKAD